MGAGLAGLLAACALAQRDWKVRVHERSQELRMFGAGIWLWENGLTALQAIERSTRRSRAANKSRPGRSAIGTVT